MLALEQMEVDEAREDVAEAVFGRRREVPCGDVGDFRELDELEAG